MKKVEILLKEKATGIIKTFYCHTYASYNNNYYLEGVKGIKNYGDVLILSKNDYERII